MQQNEQMMLGWGWEGRFGVKSPHRALLVDFTRMSLKPGLGFAAPAGRLEGGSRDLVSPHSGHLTVCDLCTNILT